MAPRPQCYPSRPPSGVCTGSSAVVRSPAARRSPSLASGPPCPPGQRNAAARRDLLERLAHTPAPGELIADIGDFNERPCAEGFLLPLAPAEGTYRLNPLTNNWGATAIDGARVTGPLATGTAHVIKPCGAQHSPVALTLPLAAAYEPRYHWIRHPLNPQGDGHPTADPTDAVDSAWDRWHQAAGHQPAELHLGGAHGSSSAGRHYATVMLLLRRHRRALALATDAGDAEAARLLGHARRLLDEAARERLQQWRRTVATHQGASTWVKGRLDDDTPTPLPPSTEPVLTEDARAHAAAADLAQRWSGHCHALAPAGEPCIRMTSLAEESGPTDPAPALPPPPPIPWDNVFQAVPPMPDLPGWTANDVLKWLPDSAPGLDGVTAADLRQLPRPLLEELAALLDRADAGHFPSTWTLARVVALPKPTGGIRPITILALLYRCWARRWAGAANAWLDTWRPPGLYGAVPRVGAMDAAWAAGMLLGAAAAVPGEDRIAIALDTEKCFDRLLLTGVFAAARAARVHPAILRVQSLYSQLRRVVWANGGPSRWGVLPTPSLTGTPQVSAGTTAVQHRAGRMGVGSPPSDGSAHHCHEFPGRPPPAVPHCCNSPRSR